MAETPAGEYVSFAEVEKAAAEARIHVRVARGRDA